MISYKEMIWAANNQFYIFWNESKICSRLAVDHKGMVVSVSPTEMTYLPLKSQYPCRVVSKNFAIQTNKSALLNLYVVTEHVHFVK